MSNLKAFLEAIAVSEGTFGHGDDGYNVLVGGQLFHSYADHPRILIHLRPDLSSTAAGRYQILKATFDDLKKKLNLPDFSPASQDLAATELIREQHAYEDVMAGHFDKAIAKVANIWASLPGAGYGQRENNLLVLRQAFLTAGGVVA